MFKRLDAADENNNDKYPVIITFDQGSVWLKRRGKPYKKITAWAWTALILVPLILFFCT